MDRTSDPRRHAPATLRNRAPILAVLQRVLPASGLLLEVASGSGEHAAWMAPQLPPGLAWQPSEPAPERRASIAAHIAEAGLSNVAPPIDLDATAPGWGARQGGQGGQADGGRP